MKLTTILGGIVLAGALFLSSCKKDNPERVTENIFKLTIQDKGLFPADEHWIVIHNESGDILDYKKVETNSGYQFSSNKPIPNDKLSITHLWSFTYIDTENNKNVPLKGWGLETYQGIDKNDQWTYTTGVGIPQNQHSSIGHVLFQVTGTIPSEPFQITTKWGVSGLNLARYSSGLLEAQANIMDEGGDDFFVFAVRNDMPVYRFFEDVVDGDTIQLDIQDFSEFDHVTTPDFPGCKNTFLMVAGTEDGQDPWLYLNGFMLEDYLTTFDLGYVHPTVKIGYLDRFTKYETRYTAYFDDYSFDFYRKGARVDEITNPKLDFAITDKSLNGYRCKVSGEFAYNFSRYDYIELTSNPEVRLTWNIFNPSSGVRTPLSKIPDEILVNHPELDVSKLAYAGSYFSLTSPAMSYNDFIGEKFRGLSPQSRDQMGYNFK